ncbi:MAG: N-acetylmuramoyl-L-alanine amidase [Bacilli bacterium]|nr:N-acetylmuramoyl-L-alanine amidase [Bacilli bacterium]
MLKYKIYVLLYFFIGILSLNIVYAKGNNLELLGKVIYLDSGHGGVDSGAVYKNIYEKDINLSISLKLQKELEKKGAIVYQTRYGDYDLSVPNTINRKRSDLSRRSNIINESKADLFISIHLNAEESGLWRGPQVFYNTNNDNNEKIAKIIQKELNKDLKGDRKYKNDNNLYLQKRLKIPGVLIEVGFLSNNNDRYLLKQENYQKKVAISITKGIVNYFN